MSSAVPCRCTGTKEERMKYWVIVTFMGNYSAFNGYHYTSSDYSSIRCLRCQGTWRTKAKYVITLTHQSTINK